MAVDLEDGRRRAKRGEERNPRVRTRFSLGVENERADAGRDSRTRLVRPKHSQTRTEVGDNIVLPCSADNVQDWLPYPVVP